MKLLAAVMLAMGLSLSPMQSLPPKPDLQIKIWGADEYMTREDFERAVNLAEKHYGKILTMLNLPWGKLRPIEMWFVGGYYGIYLRDVSIIIHTDSIMELPEDQRRAKFIYVVAHELGHHILQEAGIPLEQQHTLMYCHADIDLAKEAGTDVNFFMILSYCMS